MCFDHSLFLEYNINNNEEKSLCSNLNLNLSFLFFFPLSHLGQRNTFAKKNKFRSLYISKQVKVKFNKNSALNLDH